MSARFTRRTLLGVLAAGHAVARRALAAPPLRYTLALRPARALLGDPIVAVLACAATAPIEAATFDDASLTLELRRTQTSDPALAFVNRGGAQRGNVQMRIGHAARQHLGKGERLTREIDLVALYPTWTLDPGDVVVSYAIGEEPQTFVGGPAKLVIESGPDAVPALLRRLDGPDPAVRARSAALLHRMTGRVVGYAPDGEPGERAEAVARWHRWWERIGSRMPWSFESPGAIFEAHVPRAGGRRRSERLGGVAYLRRAPGTAGASAVASALAAWQQSPTGAPEALHGSEWIADQLFTYPGPEVVFATDAAVGTALEAALLRLARLAAAAAPTPAPPLEAAIILATVAKFPDPRFVAPLSALETVARKSPRWRPVEATVNGLLDLLDPERTIGGGRSGDNVTR